MERSCSHLIDTPGHIDFIVQVRSMAPSLSFPLLRGVEAQSETVSRQADLVSVPRLCFVNKLDCLDAKVLSVVEQIRSRLGERPLPDESCQLLFRAAVWISVRYSQITAL
jgi:elongation factor G